MITPALDHILESMVVACRKHLTLSERLLVQRAMRTRTDLMCALFKPYGGMEVTHSQCAAILLAMSKQALAAPPN